MEQHTLIAPQGAHDHEGARRLFEDFFTEYQAIFSSVEAYLGQLIKETPAYVEGYVIWRKSLQDLSYGLSMTIKKIPLPDMETFMEALTMFTFNGAIRFLEDICNNCRLKLEREWGRRFREHVDMLILAVSILHNQPQLAYVRVK